MALRVGELAAIICVKVGGIRGVRHVYNMNFEVTSWYDGTLVDFVKFAEAYGAFGQRVTDPEELKPGLEKALNANCPALVEVMVDRETDASMGPSLDKIVEYEPLPTPAEKLLTAATS